MKADNWEVLAIEEVEAAVAASRNPGALRRVIADAIGDIATGLVTHAKVPGTPCRECILKKRILYSIIYTETETEIRIWAFPHHKRQRGFWKDRLP